MKDDAAEVILAFLFGKKCTKCPRGRIKHYKDETVGLLNKTFYKCDKCKHVTSKKLKL